VPTFPDSRRNELGKTADTAPYEGDPPVELTFLGYRRDRKYPQRCALKNIEATIDYGDFIGPIWKQALVILFM